jgi:hypothetical protein
MTNLNLGIYFFESKEMLFLNCPFHKYFIIPFVDIFTFGIYGGTINRYRLEKQFQKNLGNIKNAME